MDKLNLKREWSKLLSDTDITESHQSDELYNELMAAYDEPHRHYHTAKHISEMLSLLNQSGCAEPAARWATWYHDIIYKPGHKDNEQKSALKAASALLLLGINESIVQRVQSIILATQSHLPSEGSSDCMLSVLDADMAILGSSQDSYIEYCLAVSMEFGHIPKALYQQGRSKFLQSAASQERIYQTAWFHNRFEQQARENIKQELTKLHG